MSARKRGCTICGGMVREGERICAWCSAALLKWAGSDAGYKAGKPKARPAIQAPEEWLAPEERLTAERDAWRRVATYYLGAAFTDFHTPVECLAEATRRARECSITGRERDDT